MAATCSDHTAYTRGCFGCGEANRREQSRRRERRAAGLYRPDVDAKPVGAHIRKLIRAGMTQLDIGRAAGVSQDTVQQTANGKRQRIRACHADAILAVRPVRSVRRGYVDPTGAARMLQALAVNGFGLTWQADAAGIDRMIPVRLTNGRNRLGIPRKTHDAIAALYRRLADVDAETHGVDARVRTRARQHAARKGWHGPDAWDDDTIGDPCAKPGQHLRAHRLTPQTVRVEYVRHALVGAAPRSELTRAELIEAVTMLSQQYRLTDAEIDRLLAWSGPGSRKGDAVLHFRKSHGIASGLAPATAAA